MLSAVVLRTKPDAKLASLAARGSEAAFEAIVQRYRPLLLTYCRRLLRSESGSEDVVQQVFLSAWAALRVGTEVRDIRSWLYRITHNHAVSVLRRSGDDFDELNEDVCRLTAPESELDRRVLMHEALAAVASLPELQHKAILRTALEGYSYAEVAAELGITGSAVRGLVHRARASLRRALAAFVPAPLVLWAGGQARRSCSLTERLVEIVAGGGAAGGAAVLVKGTAVLATSAVVVGGALGGAIDARHVPTRIDPERASAARVLASRSDPVSTSAETPGSGRPRAMTWLISQTVLSRGARLRAAVWRRGVIGAPGAPPGGGSTSPSLGVYAGPRESGASTGRSAPPTEQPAGPRMFEGDSVSASRTPPSSRSTPTPRTASPPAMGSPPYRVGVLALDERRSEPATPQRSTAVEPVRRSSDC
jgi:RNA polymerase sigma factor (sigma-70 family)